MDGRALYKGQKVKAVPVSACLDAVGVLHLPRSTDVYPCQAKEWVTTAEQEE